MRNAKAPRILILGLSAFVFVGLSTANASCKNALSFPSALGSEFNEVATGHLGEGGKKLRSLMDNLGINGSSSNKESNKLLGAFLFHINDSPSPIELFYDQSADKFQPIYLALHSRFNDLETFLKTNPIHGDLKLLDTLISNLLFDLNPDGSFQPGFEKISSSLLLKKLEQAKDAYANEDSDASKTDLVAQWERSQADNGETQPTPLPQFEKVPENKVITLEGEDKAAVKRLMSKMRLSDFIISQRNEAIASIAHLEELQRYAFFLIHGGSDNKLILLNSQERGLQFLIDLSSNEKWQQISKNPDVILKFLTNIRHSLDGSLEERYGHDFTADAADHFKLPLVNFREKLNDCSFFHRLMRENYRISEELNIVFEILGIHEFYPPEFE